MLHAARRRFDARPLDSLLAAVAVIVTAYALVTPFLVVRYPPMTDLPMHAAITSAFRHWFDPTWHFQDQFELQPFGAPTLTFYLLGALFALVLPIAWAVKLATLVFLSLLPIGAAVYCRGLKKDPTMGVVAAFVAWGTLTHWGFISFLGGVGLMLMGVGVAFMVLERATTKRTVILGVVSVLLFFTHVSEVPPYLVALAITTLAMAPLAPRKRAVAVGVLPTVALLIVWWFARPTSLAAPLSLGFDGSRAAKIPDWVFHSFRGTAELPILEWMLVIVLGVAVYSFGARGRASRVRRRPHPSMRSRRASMASLLIVALFVGLYFVLPLNLGIWSLVYPREITVALLFALGALPSLPRNPWHRAPALLALLMGVTMATRFVTERYATFERSTKGFQELVAELPLAPRLGYILLDKSGAEGLTIPLIHLPAWSQAEHGGWLSFHFATWGATPIRFRTSPPMDVPPATPDGFELHPAEFDLLTRGKYFDWFLVRAPLAPDARFAVDPSLHLVDHRGWWWLYRRQ